MQPRKPATRAIKTHLRVLMLALFSLCTPSLAAADAAPEPGGCDCNQAPGDAGLKPDRTSNLGRRRLGVAVFAGIAAGAFLYSARRMRHKPPRR